jgi:L-lysine exporter family protein LysE/ArgO
MPDPASASSAAAFLSGLLLGGSLIIAIGAQNVHVLRQGLRREHVGPVVLLCAALDAALMTAGVTGVAASLGAFPHARAALTVLGAGFLVWYGLGAARRALRPAALRAEVAGAARPLGPVIAQTLAVTLLNPHVYLDTVLLVGAVGASHPAALRGAFLLGAASSSAAWFFALGFGARALSPVFARPAAWRVLDGLVAVTMWGLALMLLGSALPA